MSDLWFYIMDVLGIPEVYQLIIRLIKWNTRALNDAEINIARQVFGTNLNYEVTQVEQMVTSADLLHNMYFMVENGKKNKFLIKIQD